MQEHNFIEKLEKLKEKSAIFSICNPDEKLAVKLHDLVEKLLRKTAEGDYFKISIDDTKNLLKKRGFSIIGLKEVSETIKYTVIDMLDIIDNDKDGIKNVTTIYKNNGNHIKIDKTTLKTIVQLTKSLKDLL